MIDSFVLTQHFSGFISLHCIFTGLLDNRSREYHRSSLFTDRKEVLVFYFVLYIY